MVLIEPGVVHSCNPQSGQIWSYRMMFVEAAWLHSAVARVWGLPTPPDGLEFMSRCVLDPEIASWMDQMCQPVATDAAANALSVGLPAWMASLDRAGSPMDSDQVPAELVPAMVTMQTESERRITVTRLADVCGMSSSKFIRRFHAALGMTPGTYLQNLRINGARRLLAQGMPLAEAAHTMGFSDQAHMQRAFKAHHAMTPGDYRHANSRVPNVHNS